nr:LLM class flavin-dependent oxidoreductase [Nesterenkonia muleiensis]
MKKLGFLTIGLFDPAEPAAGHESTLRIIELGEQLGFDSAWLRHRHLQFGISSPVAVMAAASQRTSRIELGTAVTPLSWENPLRLAEDLATVDVLSGGRINPGFSVGAPMHFDTVREALYPHTAEAEDFSHSRAERLAGFIAGEPVRELSGKDGVVEEFSNRVEPHSPGLRQRLWYGAGSLRSAQWAGQAGLNLLSSSVLFPDDDAGDSPDFAEVQAQQIRAFRAAHPDGGRARASQGLVVIPTDSASREQEAKYRAYVQERTPRTGEPQQAGAKRMMFAPDVIGTSDEIADALLAHAGYLEVDEVAFALPFSFAEEDYVQILTDIAARLGPALGWRPRSNR